MLDSVHLAFHENMKARFLFDGFMSETFPIYRGGQVGLRPDPDVVRELFQPFSPTPSQIRTQPFSTLAAAADLWTFPAAR